MNLYLDNIIFSLQKAGGISVYWYELCKRLMNSQKNITFVESRGGENNIFRKLMTSIGKFDILHDLPIPLSIVRYLPFLRIVPKHSIWHSSYYRIPVFISKKSKSCVTVHDFTYEKYRKGFKRIIHKYQKAISLKLADGIICVSENTKRDLLEIYPWAGEKRISVIYNGVSDLFFQLDKKLVIVTPDLTWIRSAKYAIFIGDRAYYKNFNFAVQLISGLAGYNFIIVGGGELSRTELVYLNDKLANRFKHFSGISSENLNYLYNYADFLIYPSAYEGFGIPVVEALRTGCPVIALRSSSIPEVISNENLMMSELSLEEGMRVFTYIVNNREELIKEGIAFSQKFNWDITCDKVLMFYNELLYGD